VSSGSLFCLHHTATSKRTMMSLNKDEKGLMLMILIVVQNKMKKAFYKYKKIVWVVLLRLFRIIFAFIVNDLIEEEIKSGIPEERIVS